MNKSKGLNDFVNHDYKLYIWIPDSFSMYYYYFLLFYYAKIHLNIFLILNYI